MKRVFAGTFEAKVKALLVLREKAFFPTRVVFLRRLFEGAQPFQMVPREHFYAANSRRDVEIMSNFTQNNQTNINSLNTEGDLYQDSWFKSILDRWIFWGHFFMNCNLCQVDGSETNHCLIKKFSLSPASLVAKCKGGPSLMYGEKKAHIYTLLYNRV